MTVGVGDGVQVVLGTGVALGAKVAEALGLGVAVALRMSRVFVGDDVRVAKADTAGTSGEASAS